MQGRENETTFAWLLTGCGFQSGPLLATAFTPCPSFRTSAPKRRRVGTEKKKTEVKWGLFGRKDMQGHRFVGPRCHWQERDDDGRKRNYPRKDHL